MSVQLTIFAKKRNTKEGREFTSYLTRLTRKDGTSQTMSVKFKDGEGPGLDACPMNIEVEREDINVSKKDYLNDDGETLVSYTLWVKAWSEGSPWIDASLDEFEFNEI